LEIRVYFAFGYSQRIGILTDKCTPEEASREAIVIVSFDGFEVAAADSGFRCDCGNIDSAAQPLLAKSLTK
jgi:hypothetical protein